MEKRLYLCFIFPGFITLFAGSSRSFNPYDAIGKGFGGTPTVSVQRGSFKCSKSVEGENTDVIPTANPLNTTETTNVARITENVLSTLAEEGFVSSNAPTNAPTAVMSNPTSSNAISESFPMQSSTMVLSEEVSSTTSIVDATAFTALTQAGASVDMSSVSNVSPGDVTERISAITKSRFSMTTGINNLASTNQSPTLVTEETDPAYTSYGQSGSSHDVTTKEGTITTPTSTKAQTSTLVPTLESAMQVSTSMVSRSGGDTSTLWSASTKEASPTSGPTRDIGTTIPQESMRPQTHEHTITTAIISDQPSISTTPTKVTTNTVVERSLGSSLDSQLTTLTTSVTSSWSTEQENTEALTAGDGTTHWSVSDAVTESTLTGRSVTPTEVTTNLQSTESVTATPNATADEVNPAERTTTRYVGEPSTSVTTSVITIDDETTTEHVTRSTSVLTADETTTHDAVSDEIPQSSSPAAYSSIVQATVSTADPQTYSSAVYSYTVPYTTSSLTTHSNSPTVEPTSQESTVLAGDFRKGSFDEYPCTHYDHPNYSYQGHCIRTDFCPGAKYVIGLCPAQSSDIECCFTATSDVSCATYDHPQFGVVGSCVLNHDDVCPELNYVPNLCQHQPGDVECCFSKPTLPYNEFKCSSYNHESFGYQGECGVSGTCPNNNDIPHLCPSQHNNIKCCFTVDSDIECVGHKHPQPGNVGYCTSAADCPQANYIPGLCPTHRSGVECCFAKPKEAFQESSCSDYDHPDYGSQGVCMEIGACPGTKVKPGLCSSQSVDIQCCFTATSDEACVLHIHSDWGQVGHCIDVTACPGGESNTLPGLCPNKPAEVQCCFKKPAL